MRDGHLSGVFSRKSSRMQLIYDSVISRKVMTQSTVLPDFGDDICDVCLAVASSRQKHQSPGSRGSFIIQCQPVADQTKRTYVRWDELLQIIVWGPAEGKGKLTSHRM